MIRKRMTPSRRLKAKWSAFANVSEVTIFSEVKPGGMLGIELAGGRLTASRWVSTRSSARCSTLPITERLA